VVPRRKQLAEDLPDVDEVPDLATSDSCQRLVEEHHAVLVRPLDHSRKMRREENAASAVGDLAVRQQVT
jgi:hypothetical protein